MSCMLKLGELEPWVFDRGGRQASSGFGWGIRSNFKCFGDVPGLGDQRE